MVVSTCVSSAGAHLPGALRQSLVETCPNSPTQSLSFPLTHHPAFRKFVPGSREGVSSNAFFPKPRNGRILSECFVEYVCLAEEDEGGWNKEPVVLLLSFVHLASSGEG